MEQIKYANLYVLDSLFHMLKRELFSFQKWMHFKRELFSFRTRNLHEADSKTMGSISNLKIIPMIEKW